MSDIEESYSDFAPPMPNIDSPAMHPSSALTAGDIEKIVADYINKRVTVNGLNAQVQGGSIDFNVTVKPNAQEEWTRLNPVTSIDRDSFNVPIGAVVNNPVVTPEIPAVSNEVTKLIETFVTEKVYQLMESFDTTPQAVSTEQKINASPETVLPVQFIAPVVQPDTYIYPIAEVSQSPIASVEPAVVQPLEVTTVISEVEVVPPVPMTVVIDNVVNNITDMSQPSVFDYVPPVIPFKEDSVVEYIPERLEADYPTIDPLYVEPSFGVDEDQQDANKQADTPMFAEIDNSFIPVLLERADEDHQVLAQVKCAVSEIVTPAEVYATAEDDYYIVANPNKPHSWQVKKHSTYQKAAPVWEITYPDLVVQDEVINIGAPVIAANNKLIVLSVTRDTASRAYMSHNISAMDSLPTADYVTQYFEIAKIVDGKCIQKRFQPLYIYELMLVVQGAFRYVSADILTNSYPLPT